MKRDEVGGTRAAGSKARGTATKQPSESKGPKRPPMTSGMIVMEPETEGLIRLLDEGNLVEFRRRRAASRLRQRMQMFDRVISR